MDAPLDASRDAPLDAPVDLLLDTLPCGVLSLDDDMRVVLTNETLRALLGYDVGELEGRPLSALLTVAGRMFLQTHLLPMLRVQGRADELFLPLRRKDGTDVGALANLVRHARGGATVVDCALFEARERRKYEDELLRARRSADAANALLHEANAQLQEQAVELELQHQRLGEQAAELESQSEELHGVNDELHRANDELHARAEELERTRAVANDASRAKSQFLATMSHELRTPLNAIGGYTELLAMGIHGSVTDAQRTALDRIARSQRHLLRLINDVLNLSRIEAGRVEYAVDDVPIADVVAAVMPMLEPQLAAKALTVRVTVPPDVVARGDGEKVQQIVINLLTNATKFTSAGGRVDVDARRDGAGGRGPCVYLDVRDSGIGIAADKRATIFEPFVQVDSSHTRPGEGTGLGLAISRDLARGMGGDLTVESTLGAGSTFTLTLPSA